MATESVLGKTVVITGVSRGLGRAMAREFVVQGHRVCGCSRDAGLLDELREELGAGHSLTQVDVTDDASVQAWANEVSQSVGAPDLLLNNAAVINPNAQLWTLDAAEFDQVIDINIKGVANVIRHFVPVMIEAGQGVVVNFSSGWGRSTSPEVAPYCATKWAVEGLTQALAQELPTGLAAVPLNPGVINTDMLKSCFGTSASGCPSAEEWVEVAVPFLLNLGPEHNGQALSVG